MLAKLIFEDNKLTVENFGKQVHAQNISNIFRNNSEVFKIRAVITFAVFLILKNWKLNEND